MLKGELRKDQERLAGNGQPKMPQLGHAWDIVELFIDSKHEEEGKYRAHAFLRFTISACWFKYLAHTWVLASYDTTGIPCSGGRPSGRSDYPENFPNTDILKKITIFHHELDFS